MSRHSVRHIFRRFRFPRWSISLIAASASLVSAQEAISVEEMEAFRQGRSGRPLFEWNGRVDREIHIIMRGNDAWIRQVGRTEPGRGRLDVERALPRDDGQVRLRGAGRGEIDVLQQPSARNRYTTIVRVRDPRSGAAGYHVAAYWVNSDYGYGRGRNGDFPGRGRVDDWPGRGPDWERDRGRGDDRRDGPWGNGPWGSERGERELLRWTGDVDHDVEIRIQGDRVTYHNLGGKGVRSVRVEIGRGVPRGITEVRLGSRSGRGSVQITQQPSARNGYTTIVRVRDTRSGYGRYDFSLVGRGGYVTD
ncbi:MAG TPA: hypothetical protein VLE53_15995 [Gemmatimonadaceae bacterium]|nr:hypothetical protein [Gemmatimonadaceae bacterium]